MIVIHAYLALAVPLGAEGSTMIVMKANEIQKSVL